MTILSKEEFLQQSSQGTNSLERIYKEKHLKGGPVFSLDNFNAADLYCKRLCKKQKQMICIIVQEKSFLRIWAEDAETIPNKPRDSSPAKKSETTSANFLPVENDFADFCQKLLAKEIGPIAGMVCKKTLKKHSNLNRNEFVKILAKKISDPQLAEKFQRETLD